MTPLERVLARLERVRRTGPGRHLARCPAHEDRNPSLSVREGEAGKVLLRCWVGCETAAVLGALGLQWRDLFAERDALHLDHHPLRLEPDAERRARIRRGLASWARTTGRRLRDEYRDRETIRHYAAERLLRDPDDDFGLWLYSLAVHAGRPLVELEEALDAIDGARDDAERVAAFARYKEVNRAA